MDLLASKLKIKLLLGIQAEERYIGPKIKECIPSIMEKKFDFLAI